jgi:hypothetical protein
LNNTSNSTNATIITGPPTEGGEVAGAARAARVAPEHNETAPVAVNNTQTPWYKQRILKFSGNVTDYKEDAPAGYKEDMEYEDSNRQEKSPEEIKEERKEIYEAGLADSKEAYHSHNVSLHTDKKKNPKPWLMAQQGIYPSKGSASWIEPYTQRDHAWNTDDYDQSNAATWKNHTKENNADYIDYIPALM